MPVELALPVLGAVNIVTLIPGLIWPRFNAVTVLLVIFPFTFVDGTIVVQVSSLPIGLVVSPLSLINVTVRVNQAPDAVSATLLPLSLVQGSIEPHLSTLASPCLQVRQPLANVDGPTSQLVGALFDQGHLTLFRQGWYLKGALHEVDFFDFIIFEKHFVSYRFIEFTIFSAVLDSISNLFQTLANDVAPEVCLELCDMLHEEHLVPTAG